MIVVRLATAESSPVTEKGPTFRVTIRRARAVLVTGWQSCEYDVRGAPRRACMVALLEEVTVALYPASRAFGISSTRIELGRERKLRASTTWPVASRSPGAVAGTVLVTTTESAYSIRGPFTARPSAVSAARRLAMSAVSNALRERNISYILSPFRFRTAVRQSRLLAPSMKFRQTVLTSITLLQGLAMQECHSRDAIDSHLQVGRGERPDLFTVALGMRSRLPSTGNVNIPLAFTTDGLFKKPNRQTPRLCSM